MTCSSLMWYKISKKPIILEYAFINYIYTYVYTHMDVCARMCVHVCLLFKKSDVFPQDTTSTLFPWEYLYDPIMSQLFSRFYQVQCFTSHFLTVLLCLMSMAFVLLTDLQLFICCLCSAACIPQMGSYRASPSLLSKNHI